MASNSLLSCDSISPGRKLRSPAPPSNSLISRRSLFFRPIAISSPSSLRGPTPLILTVVLQSSTNQSAAEPVAQEDTNKIRSGENTLASTENTGLDLWQLSTLNNLPTWAKFILSSVVFLAIPIFRKSFGIKAVTKVAEEVSERVEKAAEVVEKAAEEIAEALPEGNVKEAAVKLEKIALLVDKEAEFAESIIDKVDDLVEAVDTNVKFVQVEITKINEEDTMNSKKILVDQSKEATQGWWNNILPLTLLYLFGVTN